jgi:bacterioferritin-associated ferredoxin
MFIETIPLKQLNVENSFHYHYYHVRLALMIVCLCEAVSDRKVKRLARRGVDNLNDMARSCGAGSQCGSCHKDLHKIINQHRTLDKSPLSRHGLITALPQLG